MFRYNQDVPTRDQVPPNNENVFDSASPLISTILVAGTTYERVSSFCRARRSVIIIIAFACLVITGCVMAASLLIPARSEDVSDLETVNLEGREHAVTAFHKLEPKTSSTSISSKHHGHHRHHASKTPGPAAITTPVVPFTRATSVVATSTAKPDTPTTPSEVKHIVAPVLLTTTMAVNSATSPKLVNSSVSRVPGEMLTINTTLLTNKPMQTSCHRHTLRRQKLLRTALEKNPISLLNEIQEKPQFRFATCHLFDGKLVHRCIVHLPCDGSDHGPKYSKSKKTAKKLAAKAACEKVYNLKYPQEVPESDDSDNTAVESCDPEYLETFGGSV